MSKLSGPSSIWAVLPDTLDPLLFAVCDPQNDSPNHKGVLECDRALRRSASPGRAPHEVSSQVLLPRSFKLRKYYSRILIVAFCTCTIITIIIGNMLADMGVSYVDAAVPSFFFMMWLENLLIGRLDTCVLAEKREIRRRSNSTNGGDIDLDNLGSYSTASHYSVKDTWSSITSGSVQQFCGDMFKRAFMYSTIFTKFHERFGVFPLLLQYVIFPIFQTMGLLGDAQTGASTVIDTNNATDINLSSSSTSGSFLSSSMPISNPMGLFNSYYDASLTVRICSYLFTFLVGDFVYYWFHRLSHEVNIMWAGGHSVHHSSDHYNLSTALRQSAWQVYFGAFFNLSMAMLTIPRPYMVTASWVTLYQFWPHTCIVRRLPRWAELILVSPSHHRVHHDRRVHKNFAGVLIIWDRIFGTFQDELDHAAEMSVSPPRDTAMPSQQYCTDETCYFGIKERIDSWGDGATQIFLWTRLVFPSSLASVVNPLAWWRGLMYGPGFNTTTMYRPLPRPKRETESPLLRTRLFEDETLSSTTSWYVILNWVVTMTVGFSCALGLPKGSLMPADTLEGAFAVVLVGGNVTSGALLVFVFGLVSVCIHGMLLDDDIEEGAPTTINGPIPIIRKASLFWLLEAFRCVLGCGVYITLANNLSISPATATTPISFNTIPIAPAGYVSSIAFYLILLPSLFCLPISVTRAVLKLLRM